MASMKPISVRNFLPKFIALLATYTIITLFTPTSPATTLSNAEANCGLLISNIVIFIVIKKIPLLRNLLSIMIITNGTLGLNKNSI